MWNDAIKQMNFSCQQSQQFILEQIGDLLCQINQYNKDKEIFLDIISLNSMRPP